MHPRRWNFACEVEAAALDLLFADPALTGHLAALDAGVSLGLLDLSAERAAVVRRLNEAGIPMVAWLLLPHEQGYWFNLNNAPQAAACYARFRAWTARYGLQWSAVAVDIEPDIDELTMMLDGRMKQILPRLVRRAFDAERVRRGQAAYAALATQIRADGYEVESYQFPFIVDERRAGSTLLQRIFGLVDVQADHEVLMLYTSLWPEAGPGLLWSYAPQAGAIGLGSTGGGIEIGDQEVEPLSFEQLVRDLRLARRWSDDLFVFSLESCAERGFLPRLRDMDWDGPAMPPLAVARQVARWRRGLHALLWASAHPALVLGALVGLGWLAGRRPGGRRS
jgi:hypothetical protein